MIGSERHEARRIDNQLRGRSARQGDPGSSRFYLSLEDELMRLFGGGQAENLMKAFNLDPSIPIESGMLGKLVEQAQERVEGNNFDIRKHLLEYDDVLNMQRKTIYGERDHVFEKEDLQEDVLEMLRTELQKRVPEALQDEEGPWKLLAYLEEIQPTMSFEPEGVLAPSFSLKLVVDDLVAKLNGQKANRDEVRTALLDTVREALENEKEHMLRSARSLLEKTEEAIAAARDERMDTLDVWFEGIGVVEEGQPLRRPQELLDELSALVHVPLKLSGELFRKLPEGDEEVKDALREQIEASLVGTNLNRVVMAFERRLGDTLGVNTGELQSSDWNSISGTLLDQVDAAFERRQQRLIGTNGLVAPTLDSSLAKMGSGGYDENALLRLLIAMTQGSRLEIDPRTKRRLVRKITLLNYFYLAAKKLGDFRPDDILKQILEHLETIRERLQSLWGRTEFERLAQQNIRLDQFDEKMQAQFVEALGQEYFDANRTRTLFELESARREAIHPVLGTRVQNSIYRQILLGAISELWIDYLTRVESLRISIGMESYAQRDPLVAYKSRATELFQNLLADIRMAVISRMFLLQPRRATQVAEGTAAQLPQQAQPAQQASQQAQPQGHSDGSGKKRKRHRH